MSSVTLAQTAEKPITVAIDEAINSFADNRQGRPDIKALVVPLGCIRLRYLGCARNIAVAFK
jgi:hypothetical protein